MALNETAGPGPQQVWDELDDAWREAFRQAWGALQTGNVPVGACVATRSGDVIHAARNRVMDSDGPRGEVWGSSLAHAEINALARVEFRRHGELVLTTTLEPCLQCAAAIRLSPVTIVRFAGSDRFWAGCHDFARLSEREAARTQATRIGPREDELGLFATVISRIGPALSPAYQEWLCQSGEAPIVDLALRLAADERRLASLDVASGFAELWPELRSLRQQTEVQP